MKNTLIRTFGLASLFAIFSASAFAEREIVCTAKSHIVNEIRKIELRLDLPVNDPASPGYARFIRGPGKQSLTAPIYATTLSMSPSNGEELFTWNESITGSVDGVSQSYDLELVKKNAARKSGASWVLRGSKIVAYGPSDCHPDQADCGYTKVLAFEAPISCTDSYDSIVEDPNAAEKRCADDPHHCQK
jgi:hypothetical protein